MLVEKGYPKELIKKHRPPSFLEVKEWLRSKGIHVNIYLSEEFGMRESGMPSNQWTAVIEDSAYNLIWTSNFLKYRDGVIKSIYEALKTC